MRFRDFDKTLKLAKTWTFAPELSKKTHPQERHSFLGACAKVSVPENG